MKFKNVFTIFVFLVLIPLVLAQQPPSLTDFHQLYGTITNLPEGSFTLQATIGIDTYTTEIGTDSRYGYSPTFKVFGREGQTISFAVVNNLDISTPLTETFLYQNRGSTLLSLQYPVGGEGIAGCTDITASNYDAGATLDDGTCILAGTITGCTNSTATNFNPIATVDDDSCQFAEDEEGCTDPSASNYDEDAVIGDGGCEYEGCMVEEATNYNATMTDDDGSCEFPDDITAGCMNESASNYDEDATIQYGDCEFLEGCTNSTATNYNSSAEIDDGSCIYEEDEEEPQLTACLQNWECSGWGTCISNQQTRICVRIDNCDQLQAQGTATVTVIPKPDEQRYCLGESAAALPTICTPNQKRCSGNLLEQCSFDGRKWNFLESCTAGCNPVSLRCRVETPAPVTVKEPSSAFPIWIIIVVIVIILAGGGGAAAFIILNQRKLAPAKGYVSDSRAKGFSDKQIRTKLLGQGWNEKQVEKILK